MAFKTQAGVSSWWARWSTMTQLIRRQDEHQTHSPRAPKSVERLALFRRRGCLCTLLWGQDQEGLENCVIEMLPIPSGPDCALEVHCLQGCGRSPAAMTLEHLRAHPDVVGCLAWHDVLVDFGWCWCVGYFGMFGIVWLKLIFLEGVGVRERDWQASCDTLPLI